MNKIRNIDSILDSVSITHKFKKDKLVFLNTSDVLEGKILIDTYTDVKTLKGQAKKTIKNEDILFSEIRPKNKRYAFVKVDKPEDYVVSTKLMVLRNKTNDVLTKYVYYFLTYDGTLEYLQMRAENRIGSFPQITFDLLKILELNVPDLSIQQKIVEVISLIDSKIELNNSIKKELEDMAKTLYDYWFLQFDFPNANGKPYKTSGGKMVWNEPFKREIPRDWDVVKIENVLANESATKKIPYSEILNEGTIPIIDQSADFIAGFTNDKDSIIKSNEPRIIFGDHTRILKFINFDFARGADGTQVLLSNTKRMPQHLFYHSLLKIDLSNYGYARHFKFLKEYNIILPNETIAQKFEYTIKSSFDLIKHIIFQNQRLSSLRDWLFPMLMNGQVKLR